MWGHRGQPARHCARHRGGALAEHRTRVFPGGAGQEYAAPIPHSPTSPSDVATETASARRQTPTTPKQASLPSHCMPPPHPHPWSGFIQDSGEGETPTTPARRPYPGNVATSCGETVSEMAHLGNPRMLASLSPPVVGLKWLKPTPLSRKRGKQLGACPSAHPLRAEAASAPSCLSCTQLLSQALKRSNHLQGLLAASASPELWFFFLPWLCLKDLSLAMRGDAAFLYPIVETPTGVG